MPIIYDIYKRVNYAGWALIFLCVIFCGTGHVKVFVKRSPSVALCVTVSATHRNFSTYTSVICHIASDDELDQYHTKLSCFKLFYVIVNALH